MRYLSSVAGVRRMDALCLPAAGRRYANLASIFDHTFQCSDIFLCHAGGNLVLLQTFEAFARFVKGCAHIFLSAIWKNGDNHTPIQRHRFL